MFEGQDIRFGHRVPVLAFHALFFTRLTRLCFVTFRLELSTTVTRLTKVSTCMPSMWK